MKILVTGGCGYIGSHTCVELLNEDYEVVVIDNLSNADRGVVKKIENICNKKISFHKFDLRNKKALERLFSKNKFDAVIHFAGLKAVGESVEKPLDYYDNNINSTIKLCEVMKEYDCKNLVFSSSATVYGKPKTLPIKEDAKTSTTNPYGSTKLFIEEILKDLYNSDNTWSITILRYFNPIGSHDSYLIGENPKGKPNNLMPYLVKVATHEYNELSIFGNDYNTHDGTGVRDYIHVVDLAKFHVKALEKKMFNKELNIYNIGTGKGYSVLDLVNTFEKVNHVKIKYKIVGRRPGDIDECYANVNKANNELGYKCTKTLEDMCIDSYNYVVNKKD